MLSVVILILGSIAFHSEANDCSLLKIQTGQEIAEVCVNVDLTETPQGNKLTTLVANLSEKETGSLEVSFAPEELRWELFMPKHGHGSRPLEIQFLPNSKTFLLKKASFSMKGDWVMRVSQVVNGSTVSTVDVPLPKIESGFPSTGHNH